MDNSVVIVDSYLEKLNQGVARKEAAVESAREYVKAIASATLAICLAFLPFLFVLKGINRDLIVAFPCTILLTLGISWAVAVLVIPFCNTLSYEKDYDRGKRREAQKGNNIAGKMAKWYEWLLAKYSGFPI